MPRRWASATAIFSLRGSMMKTAAGSCSIVLMPTSAFSSFSRSRSSSSASFFGTRSYSPVSFIFRAAMGPPSVRLRRAQQARPGGRAPPPKVRGVCNGELRRVLGVEPHVLLAQIARPHAVLAASESQIDPNLVFRQSHDLPNPFQTHAFLHHPPLDQGLVTESDPHFGRVDPGRRLPEGHHDPSPVGVLAVDRGLDQG